MAADLARDERLARLERRVGLRVGLQSGKRQQQLPINPPDADAVLIGCRAPIGGDGPPYRDWVVLREAR